MSKIKLQPTASSFCAFKPDLQVRDDDSLTTDEATEIAEVRSPSRRKRNKKNKQRKTGCRMRNIRRKTNKLLNDPKVSELFTERNQPITGSDNKIYEEEQERSAEDRAKDQHKCLVHTQRIRKNYSYRKRINFEGNTVSAPRILMIVMLLLLLIVGIVRMTYCNNLPSQQVVGRSVSRCGRFQINISTNVMQDSYSEIKKMTLLRYKGRLQFSKQFIAETISVFEVYMKMRARLKDFESLYSSDTLSLVVEDFLRSPKLSSVGRGL